jgi:hypothetical protein
MQRLYPLLEQCGQRRDTGRLAGAISPRRVPERSNHTAAVAERDTT